MMSEEEKREDKPKESGAEAAPPESTPVRVAYAGPSGVEAGEGTAQLTLYGNLYREPVRFEGQIKNPLRFREAMSALYTIVGSDYRYVPKDRTAYLAYIRMKRESSSMNVWESQQAYYSWMMRNDPAAAMILDPIISVHPDRIFFEVFSKDEGTYANLTMERSAFQMSGEPVCGTTNIDFSAALHESIQQMRSYRQTHLTIGKDVVKMATADKGEVLEKQINVPDTWLRGFLQVQSSATLPLETCTLAPIDLYNVLRQLRMHGDRKGQRRGLRVELVPGQEPRLVLEPWETVLPSTSGIFKGKAARIVRIWGRRRLLLLRRLLPFVERVDVHLLGSGLPSFWVLRAGDMTMSMGLTGFTATNWSQAASFDLLLPRKTQTPAAVEKVDAQLNKVWLAGTKELSQSTGLKGAALIEALQVGCQQGRIMYDLADNVYRHRPITEGALDLARLQYRNQRERIAHDLLVRRGAVRIVSENRIAGTGLELTGRVNVEEDKREYRPQMLLGDEGQVGKVECTCTFFRKQGLKAGPCAHLIALRLAYAEQEAKRKEGVEAKEAVQVETRTYSKRDEQGEDVVQMSLERQRVKMRWGRSGQPMRLQTLRFNTLEEARAAYYTRVEELDRSGYLNASAG